MTAKTKQPDYPQIPAAEIALRREKLALTIKQIARALRVSEATWTRWERETSAPAFVHFLLAYLESGAPQPAAAASRTTGRSREKDLARRFAEKTTPTDNGCLVWTAGGKFKARGENLAPRKAAWLLRHGAVPLQDVVVLCGNQKCVAAAHLALGKRSGTREAISPAAKSAILLELRAGKSGAELAAKYSVSAGTVSALKKKVEKS